MRLPTETRIQEPSDQQEEAQHHDGVEIGVFTAAYRFKKANPKREAQRQ